MLKYLLDAAALLFRRKNNVPNVANVSRLFVFVMCLVYPMLPMSLGCLSSSCVLYTQCCQCLQVVCLRHVSCVPTVANVSRLFVFVLCLVYPMFPMSLGCPFLCVVLWFCALFVFVMCLVYPMFPMSLGCLSSSCVLYTQCCQCLWIVHF